MNVNLTEWVEDNIPEYEMLYKNAFMDQLHFLEFRIKDMLLYGYKIRDKYDNIVVISEHTSKSIKLPVVKIQTIDFNIIIRANFYDWKISIESKEPINIDFKKYKLFDTSEKINPAYCEGFKDEWVYDCFDNNKSKFTLEISDHYNVWVFFYLLKNLKEGE